MNKVFFSRPLWDSKKPDLSELGTAPPPRSGDSLVAALPPELLGVHNPETSEKPQKPFGWVFFMFHLDLGVFNGFGVFIFLAQAGLMENHIFYLNPRLRPTFCPLSQKASSARAIFRRIFRPERKKQAKPKPNTSSARAIFRQRKKAKASQTSKNPISEDFGVPSSWPPSPTWRTTSSAQRPCETWSSFR